MSADVHPVLEVPNRVFDETVERLLVYCSQSSASGDTRGLSAMARMLAADFEALGLAPEVHGERDDGGCEQPVLVARGPEAGDRFLLLVGHLDTVLPAVPPCCRRERIEGTGALDMKGGFAAFWGALTLARERGWQLPGDLLVLAVPDEEVGGSISERMMREWGARARAVLVLEPGASRNEVETLVTGRRGLCGWRMEARGRASHSGLAYWEGRSALAAAAAWCARVHDLSERGSGPTVNVSRIVGGDAELVEDLEEHHALVGTNRRLNIVADRCLAEGEIRFLNWQDRDGLLQRMERIASEVAHETEVQFDLRIFETIPPFDPQGPGAALAAHAVEAARRSGWMLELEPNRGGVSFPNLLPDPAAVPVLDGLGPVGGGMHTRDEYLELRSLRRRMGLLAELLAHRL